MAWILCGKEEEESMAISSLVGVAWILCGKEEEECMAISSLVPFLNSSKRKK